MGIYYNAVQTAEAESHNSALRRVARISQMQTNHKPGRPIPCQHLPLLQAAYLIERSQAIPSFLIAGNFLGSAYT